MHWNRLGELTSLTVLAMWEGKTSHRAFLHSLSGRSACFVLQMDAAGSEQASYRLTEAPSSVQRNDSVSSSTHWLADWLYQDDDKLSDWKLNWTAVGAMLMMIISVQLIRLDLCAPRAPCGLLPADGAAPANLAWNMWRPAGVVVATVIPRFTRSTWLDELAIC